MKRTVPHPTVALMIGSDAAPGQNPGPTKERRVLPHGGCRQARRGSSQRRERRRKAIAELALKIVALAALVGGVAAAGGIDDKKADATGPGKWVRKSPDGQEFETTASLKQEGAKLTGNVTTEAGESDIKNGTVMDGNVTFQISIDAGGSEIHVKFTGKLQGDSIKG